MYADKLRELGIEISQFGATNKPIKVRCPKCADSKRGKRKDMSVHIGEGWYKCHSASCGYHGSVSRMKPPKHDLPEEEKGGTSDDPVLIKYFEKRGISKETVLKLGITMEKGIIYFNYFENGIRVNYKARSQDKTKSWQSPNAKKTLYNIDSCKGKKKAILVEGEIDAASLVEAGLDEEYGIISVDQGAGSPAKYDEDGIKIKEPDKLDGKLECLKNCAEMLDQIEQFILFFDLDPPGQFTQDEVVRRLHIHRCKKVDPSLTGDIKDANDILVMKDSPKELNIKVLQKVIEQARQIAMPGVAVLEGDIQAKILKIYREGLSSAHPSRVLPHFSFIPGMTTLITGIPAHGKSIFARFIAMTLSKCDNWKWALYCPEDYPMENFYQELIQQYLGKNVIKGYNNRCTEEEFREGMNFVRDHFFPIMPVPDNKGVVQLPTNAYLNERINFLKLKFGVNAYIKDPWNKISHNLTVRDDRYLQEELSKEKFFSEQYSAAIYIAHPSRMTKGKDGKYPVPDPYNISGGAMWYNQMDNQFTVNRPNIHLDIKDTLTDVHNWKNKDNQRAGIPEKQQFDFDIAAKAYHLLNTEGKREDRSDFIHPGQDLPW